MINVNDLIGLVYGWGHRPDDGSGKTDCFQLACEIHRRLGFGDYSPQYNWVYAEYTDDTFPRRRMARWLLENGIRCKHPKPGAVVLLPVEVGAALGTYIDSTDVLFIGPGHHVIRAPLGGIGQIFWMNR